MLLSDFNRNIFSFIFVRLFVVFVSIHSKNDDMRATDSPFSTKKKPAENRKCCRSLELKMIINMEISVGSSFQKPKKIHRTTDETTWELIKILCRRSISAFFSHSSDLRFLIGHSVAYFPVLSRHQTNKRPLRSGLSAHSALSLSLSFSPGLICMFGSVWNVSRKTAIYFYALSLFRGFAVWKYYAKTRVSSGQFLLGSSSSFS